MRRLFALSLGISLVLFPIMCYTYVRGCQDGIARYKKSKQFELTLYSMYKFGFIDGYREAKGK